MARKAETTFRQNKVIPFLKTLPCAYFPIQQKTIRGDADFILCINGRFVWLELKKSKDDRPDSLQRYKATWVDLRGGIAFVAYPENWEEIKNKIWKIFEGD